VRGFGNQTKAPTGLNVDSSRGHTIFTLEVNKIIKNPKAKKKSEKEQVVHTAMKLVDLAGSERTEKVLEITKEQLEGLLTQKYGKPTKVTDKMMASYKEERTTEGKSINNSLTTLGNCVKQVAIVSGIEDLKLRKQKMDQIAWRTSSLTRLLRTALNGNCKTIMIAAVSPSLTEYPETLSTMRYANQIKAIKSTAKKKEAQLTGEQLAAIKIKELEDALKAALENATGGGGGGGGADPEAMRQLQEQMDEMKRKEDEYHKKEEAFNAQMRTLKEEQKKRSAIREV
jgi:molybdenum-dependent DNA-binding transcriptional regulator ModE